MSNLAQSVIWSFNIMTISQYQLSEVIKQLRIATNVRNPPFEKFSVKMRRSERSAYRKFKGGFIVGFLMSAFGNVHCNMLTVDQGPVRIESDHSFYNVGGKAVI